MITENITNRVVMLGDNEFQGGKITLAAGATAVAGAVLKRSGADFALAAAADEYTAVNPFEIKNDTEAAKTFGFRALVLGRVRADMLRVGAAATTVADNDKLRKVGILPVKVTDLSQKDNQ
jgi:hypothetical protein